MKVACATSLLVAVALLVPPPTVRLSCTVLSACSPVPLALEVGAVNLTDVPSGTDVVAGTISPSDSTDEVVAGLVGFGASVVNEGRSPLDTLEGEEIADVVGRGKLGVDRAQLGVILMEIVASGM